MKKLLLLIILLLIGSSTPSLSQKVFCVGQTGNLYELNSCDNSFITLSQSHITNGAINEDVEIDLCIWADPYGMSSEPNVVIANPNDEESCHKKSRNKRIVGCKILSSIVNDSKLNRSDFQRIYNLVCSSIQNSKNAIQTLSEEPTYCIDPKGNSKVIKNSGTCGSKMREINKKQYEDKDYVFELRKGDSFCRGIDSVTGYQVYYISLEEDVYAQKSGCSYANDAKITKKEFCSDDTVFFGYKEICAEIKMKTNKIEKKAKTTEPEIEESEIYIKLKKLKSFYDQGLITKDEYDQKRKKILDTMN